ncbi:endonuclease/exonuclease/phosphatase family protein [Haloferula sp.]|uniref:endonuclease/exonuclease/phosphatase family protein n=1 Tax=Haloferula sp. TaxID=2497595 RepID=UPI003C75F114
MQLRAFFLLAVCLFSPSRAADLSVSDDLRLKVVSFNIRYLTTRDKGVNHWDTRQTRVADAIRHLDADVIGMQEAFFSQIGDLEAVLSPYHRVGVGRDDGAEEGETCSIFFRRDRFHLVDHGTFWLSNTPEVPGSKHWGNEVVRICTWALLRDKPSDRPFYVFNTHFDHVSQEAREQSARLISERIAERSESNAPFILMGDFNAAEDNPAIRYLKGEAVALAGGEDIETTPIKMLDSFRVNHPDAIEVRTGHSFKGLTEGGKIDHVFVPQGTTVEAAAIDRFQQDGLYPSDHFPVTATLMFAAGP